jgi:hypothetical protein
MLMACVVNAVSRFMPDCAAAVLSGSGGLGVETKAVLLFQYSDDKAVTTGAKMVSKASFDLAAEAFAKSHDFRLFGYRRHSLVAELLEDIMTDGLQELPRPAMAGDGHMQIGTLEAVKDATGNDLPALLDAESRKGWKQANSDPIADEADHTLVSHDHDRMSPMS